MEKHIVKEITIDELAVMVANGFKESGRNLNEFKKDMYEFRDEMLGFKSEMYEFRDEMLGFKSEMYEFRDEMLGFKSEMYEFRNEMLGFKSDVQGFKGDVNGRLANIEENMATKDDIYRLEKRFDTLEKVVFNDHGLRLRRVEKKLQIA